MTDIVVLGGGPAGLAAAWWAARRGLEVTLLERQPDVGGLAASFDVHGIRVDHGSHRLHPAIDGPILAELRSLLGADLQRRHRNGRLRLGGRWLSFPLRPPELIRRLPPRIAAGVVADAIAGPLRRPRADTYAEVVRGGVGPTLGEHLYFPYARKLWGTEPQDLAGEQARRRIGSPSALAVARTALRRRAADRPHGTFWYPKRGFGQLVEALAGAAVDAGADIRTGHEVTGLSVQPGEATVTTSGGELRAGIVLSTIPLPALVRLVGEESVPAPPAEVVAAARRLRSRGMVLVYLAVAGSPYTSYDAHYVPGPETPLSRLSEPSRYRDGDDPPDRTVLCAEIPCWPGDDRWSMPDGDLVHLVVEGLHAVGLPAPQVLEAVVRRVAHVYPVYGLDHDRSFAAVDRWASALPAVVTLGRQGLHAHDNTHHTLAMAREAVGAIVDGRLDEARWRAARERFATHVVED